MSSTRAPQLNEPFDVQVDRWVKKAKTKATQAYQATALLALARVQQLTPVDTGNLRAHWTISLTPEIAVGRDQTPFEVVAHLNVGQPFYIVNPVVYARRIEYGFVGEDSLGRHYDEKGRHMMEQTIAEMPIIAQVATQWVIDGHNPYSIGMAPASF
ncbi:HK97 gp10 family phage protein [Acidiphilium angustum]|uniref:HK97 gp10 family phage protein n=1 Tax=Acidiphilium angustum TaxID=523 RepID=UPI000494AC2D|nr:HK97 gp10 family phage protein [Acidiphilium angustum]